MILKKLIEVKITEKNILLTDKHIEEVAKLILLVISHFYQKGRY